MKVLIAAASAAAILAAPAFAMAQTGTAAPSFYGTLGYAGSSVDSSVGNVDLGAIQGRLGARFGNYFGVEGELSGGVHNDHVDVAGTEAKVKLEHQEAIYGVGFFPLTPQIDLLARVGYGDTRAKVSGDGVGFSDAGNSWNYGVGAQYSFDGKNGVRADYTREEFRNDDAGHADVWSIAYTRRF
jgi:hypothetical protein